MNEKQLRKNLRLYGWFKVFNKRVFLPTTAIYLVDVGHVSIHGIGLIAVVTALASLAAQMPTGYFADRHTRRLSMVIGSVLLVFGVGVLVFAPSLVGGLASGILTGLGFSFISGADQALMHDSLEQAGQGDQFVKQMGRAQSQGLIGNIVLIALVPMTYTLDKRLPFILGVVASIILLALSWSFVEPKREKQRAEQNHAKALIVAVRTFVDRRTWLLFVAIGLAFGLYFAPLDYTNLILKDLGMAPQYIGWVFAGTSLLGAVGGYGIHYLERFSFRAFMFVDIVICCGFFVLVGLTRSLPIAVAAIVINFSFWRLRGILYQNYLLRMFKGTQHKATLASLLGFGEQLFVVLLPMVFAFAIARQGYYTAYAVMGVLGAVALAVLTVLGFDMLKRGRPEAVPAPVELS